MPDPAKPDILVVMDEDPRPVPRPVPPPPPPDEEHRLNPFVQLSMGSLSYIDGDRKVRSLQFQFNPTELDRSRTVKFTRTLTGNTLEEQRAGLRNQTKRKFTRKPEAWTMTLALRFDAGYCGDAATTAGAFSHRVDRLTEAMRFFEALVEPSPFPTENNKIANADETPPPPLMFFYYGTRSWQCAVKTLRIKEEEFTRDLYPRRFEATLTLELVETVQQNTQGKTGASR